MTRLCIQIDEEDDDNLEILKATPQDERETTEEPSAGRRRGQKRKRSATQSRLAAAREIAKEEQAARSVSTDVNNSPVNMEPDESTMELRKKKNVSYSENSWHVPFSQMLGTTNRAAEDAVRTVQNPSTRIAIDAGACESS